MVFVSVGPILISLSEEKGLMIELIGFGLFSVHISHIHISEHIFYDTHYTHLYYIQDAQPGSNKTVEILFLHFVFHLRLGLLFVCVCERERE